MGIHLFCTLATVNPCKANDDNKLDEQTCCFIDCDSTTVLVTSSSRQQRTATAANLGVSCCFRLPRTTAFVHGRCFSLSLHSIQCSMACCTVTRAQSVGSWKRRLGYGLSFFPDFLSLRSIFCYTLEIVLSGRARYWRTRPPMDRQ